MPDQLFDQFHLDVTPPPAEEVRRRGDRRRRRTSAAVALAGAAAVLAVVAPVAVLSRGTDRGEPQPSHTGSVAPSVSAGWVTTIPRSFDLTAGMATTPAPTQQVVDPDLLLQYNTAVPLEIGGCDAPLWGFAGVKASLVAQWTDRVEASEVRSLSPYADGAGATAAFDQLQQGVGGCPGGPLSPVVVPLDATALPAASLAWVQPKGSGTTPDGTGIAYVVVQVHNVLIIDRANMNGTGDANARRLTVKHLAARLSAVVSAAEAAFPSPTS